MTANPKEKNAVQGRYAVQEIKTVTADYTLRADDCGTLILVNSGSGKTVTVPSGLPVGFVCDFIQIGAGAITFAAGSNATLNNLTGFDPESAGQYAGQRVNVYSTAVSSLTGQLAASA